MLYKFFDGVVSSAVMLPCLKPAEDGVPRFQVSVRSGQSPEGRIAWFHRWHQPDGNVALEVGRSNAVSDCDAYALRFPDLAEFMIYDNQVECFPAENCCENTLVHLLVDQVLPRCWAHDDHLVLHGGTVELNKGRVAIFLGETGLGKSTLTAALGGRGALMLGDDCVELRVSDNQILVIPSYNGLRLNPDSLKSLGFEGQGWDQVANYSDKLKCSLEGSKIVKPEELDLYILVDEGDCDVVQIEPLAGSSAAMDVIKSSFVLDPNSIQSSARQLAQVVSLIDRAGGLSRLDYPRDFDSLNSVCTQLLSDAG